MLKIETSDYLDNLLKDFFPESGRWQSNCFRREESVSEINLPCHLRNVEWLTSLIIKKYQLYSLEEETIKKYVRDSLYFNKLRSEYEQRIVKWQIAWMMNDGENWLVAPKYGGEMYIFNTKCDYAFRKGIVDTLLAIGMNIDVIEEGIEKNADMWRNYYMEQAFINEFDPVWYKLSIDKDNDAELKEPDLEFKENWLKYRKYKYYHEHKTSIDKYSIPEPEMLMLPEEVKKLELYLEEKSLERCKELEEYDKTRCPIFELYQMSQRDFYQLSYQDALPDQQDGKPLKELIKRLGLRKKSKK